MTERYLILSLIHLYENDLVRHQTMRKEIERLYYLLWECIPSNSKPLLSDSK